MTASPRAVLALIRKGESETLEFKESFGREAIEILCSFANTSGGAVLIGVNDKGAVIGIPAPRKALKDWADQIAQATELHPSIVVESANGLPVISIRVPESRIKPVMFQGRAFKRSGSTTRLMSVEEITRAAMATVDITWDKIPEVRASMADISVAKVKAFVRMANEKGRRPMPARIPTAELLQKLKLIRQGRPTRAAILLFGKAPQDFYGQALLKVGRFRSETLIVDDREIEGTVFEQIEGAIGYFREKLDTRFVMTGRPQRDVVWEYPLEALREAVTNAVCHRDYLSAAHVQVRIYDRELLVMNPGGLPAGLSVEALKRSHHSVPRNRQIAGILFYAGLIEQWGSGIEKMMRECSAAGMPEPAFESDMAFKLTFRKAAAEIAGAPDKHRTSTGQAPGKHRASTGQVQKPEIRKLLTYCGTQRRVRQIMAHMGLRHRDTFTINYLRPLLEQGLLAMTAPDAPRSPKQGYVTTEKGRALIEAHQG